MLFVLWLFFCLYILSTIVSLVVSTSAIDSLERHISEAGCLQIQPNKFPGDFQDTFNKFPAGFFTLIEPPKYYNTRYNHKHFQLCTL